MRKKHLYLQNYKKETPLFLLGKDLIKLLLGCQKLCHKNFIKPFAPLPMVTEDLSNKNYVFVRLVKIFNFKEQYAQLGCAYCSLVLRSKTTSLRENLILLRKT